jgi:dephospho-CoA kinase
MRFELKRRQKPCACWGFDSSYVGWETEIRIVLLVGLTGGIASGKSTVSKMLTEFGVPVICLDELAHLVTSPGSPAIEEIRALFGDSAIDSQGGMDRAVVGKIVFADKEARSRLERIIHPRVGAEAQARAAAYAASGHRVVFMDVPLLYEVKWERMFDCIVVVYVDPETQEKRLALRDAMEREEATKRIQAQIPIEEKKKRADYVIDNSGTEEDTRRAVTELLRKLEEREESTRVG